MSFYFFSVPSMNSTHYTSKVLKYALALKIQIFTRRAGVTIALRSLSHVFNLKCAWLTGQSYLLQWDLIKSSACLEQWPHYLSCWNIDANSSGEIHMWRPCSAGSAKECTSGCASVLPPQCLSSTPLNWPDASVGVNVFAPPSPGPNCYCAPVEPEWNHYMESWGKAWSILVQMKGEMFC